MTENNKRTPPKSPFLIEEYKSRINKVIDYIEKKIDRSFSLEELASVANFSKFHFHRIFYVFIGETLFRFIQRLRVEKGAALLLMNIKDPISKIAFDCGFSSQSAFARAFKERYGMSAGKWREEKMFSNSNFSKTNSNHYQQNSNKRKESEISMNYHDNIFDSWRKEMKKNFKTKKPENLEIKQLDDMYVAYVRHIGPYAGDSELFAKLYEKLFSWAGPRGLAGQKDMKCLNIYHDNPEITDEKKLRVSVCMTVPEKTEVDGEIGKMKVEGGKYAVARFALAQDEFQSAWNYLFGDWLPNSGYQPDDRLCFEMCLNDPKDDPDGNFLVDICIPVKPL
jgi:AraC family transcriptional regulator